MHTSELLSKDMYLLTCRYIEKRKNVPYKQWFLLKEILHVLIDECCFYSNCWFHFRILLSCYDTVF